MTFAIKSLDGGDLLGYEQLLQNMSVNCHSSIDEMQRELDERFADKARNELCSSKEINLAVAGKEYGVKSTSRMTALVKSVQQEAKETIQKGLSSSEGLDIKLEALTMSKEDVQELVDLALRNEQATQAARIEHERKLYGPGPGHK